MDIIDNIHTKLSVLVLMTARVHPGILRTRNKDSGNIYEYYCDSINRTNLIFAKTHKSDTTNRDISRR